MHETQVRFANPDVISLTAGQSAPCSGAAALERSDNLVKVCALTPLQFAALIHHLTEAFAAEWFIFNAANLTNCA